MVNIVTMWLHISINHDYLTIYQSTSQHDDEDAVILAKNASLSTVRGVFVLPVSNNSKCMLSLKDFQDLSSALFWVGHFELGNLYNDIQLLSRNWNYHFET